MPKTTSRPKASKSKSTATNVITAVQPHELCLVCGGDEFRYLGEYPPTYYAGQLDDGTSYDAIVRKLVACTSCGQQTVHKSYEILKG